VKRFLKVALAFLSSRILPPVVVGLFLLVYICIAFFTEDALTSLIALAGHSLLLALLFSLLPLNSACRILKESLDFRHRRRALAGGVPAPDPALFDESVRVAAAVIPPGVEKGLISEGYRTSRRDGTLTASRGWSSFPARMLYLSGTFCLFFGILISVTTRVSERGALVEGVAIPATAGRGMVQKIELKEGTGSILSKKLTMVITEEGGSPSNFGLYPPSAYQGAFLYPRYLGVGIQIQLTAPDLQGVHEKRAIMNLYPAGKEDATEIPGTGYRCVVSLASPDDGRDPYVTGRMIFNFKLLKGNEEKLSGRIPGGGEFTKDGFRVAFPDCRRLVITDFIRDYGVHLIWASCLLFILAGCLWLPLRTLLPRRELLIITGDTSLLACSRAEGRRRGHAEVFHELLDSLESGKSGGAPVHPE
jgi:hypothetical protein